MQVADTIGGYLKAIHAQAGLLMHRHLLGLIGRASPLSAHRERLCHTRSRHLEIDCVPGRERCVECQKATGVPARIPRLKLDHRDLRRAARKADVQLS